VEEAEEEDVEAGMADEGDTKVMGLNIVFFTAGPISEAVPRLAVGDM